MTRDGARNDWHWSSSHSLTLNAGFLQQFSCEKERGCLKVVGDGG